MKGRITRTIYYSRPYEEVKKLDVNSERSNY